MEIEELEIKLLDKLARIEANGNPKNKERRIMQLRTTIEETLCYYKHMREKIGIRWDYKIDELAAYYNVTEDEIPDIIA